MPIINADFGGSAGCRQLTFRPSSLLSYLLFFGETAFMKAEACSHLRSLDSIKHPQKSECEECIKIGDSWVHLRTCQTCGVTLCCDSSPNKHASKHARSSSHPVIASAQPGERWVYCYPDDSFAEY